MARASGVLMHITSLWGRYGSGSFGSEAFEWIDFLSENGFAYWQVLPFGIPDGYHSPYSSLTAFGGNPYMITNGVNGFVVPERNPSAVTEAILRIMDDPVLHEKLRDGAYAQYKAKFTASAMTKQLENLYLKED